MRLRSLLIKLTLAVLAFSYVPSKAERASDPVAFLESFLHGTLQSLADRRLSPEDREQHLAKVLENNFDLERIARIVLGRYWDAASEQERRSFVAVFEHWIIRVYGQRVVDASGDDIKLTGMRPLNENNFSVSSRVVLSEGAPPADILWRVRRQGDDYKIFDVDFEGVSVAMTHREEFASWIQRNGGSVADLTRTLSQMGAAGGGSSPSLRPTTTR